MSHAINANGLGRPNMQSISHALIPYVLGHKVY